MGEAIEKNRERKPFSPLPCVFYFLAPRTAPPSINPPKVIKPRMLEGSGVVAGGSFARVAVNETSLRNPGVPPP